MAEKMVMQTNLIFLNGDVNKYYILNSDAQTYVKMQSMMLVRKSSDWCGPWEKLFKNSVQIKSFSFFLLNSHFYFVLFFIHTVILVLLH